MSEPPIDEPTPVRVEGLAEDGHLPPDSPGSDPGWWQRLRGRAASAIVSGTPASGPLADQPVPPGPAGAERLRLLRMGPFSIGFFGTVGAMTAFALWLAIAQLQTILVIVVVSLFLALGLSPIVDFLVHRAHMRRWLAVLIVAVGLLGLIALAGSVLFPLLAEQVKALVANYPAYVQGLRHNGLVAQLDSRFGVIAKVTAALSGKDLLPSMFGGILGAGKLLANAVFSFVVTIVLTLYFLSSLPQIKNAIYRFAPNSRRPRVQYLANEMFDRIGGYLTGMFIVVTCAATCAFIMMSIIGMGQYALALAFVVAIFAFIPLVGSTMSMVVVGLVALSVNPLLALIVVIYFLAYSQFEAYVLQPRVMAHSVNVPGAVTVVAAIAGGSLLGIVGALMAIPTAAAVLLLYREVLVPHLDRS